MDNILLFGGTADGRLLAQRLVEQGCAVTISVATPYGAALLPKHLPGFGVHIGRLSVEEMALLMRQGFTQVVDATHPYAVEVSGNIHTAAKRAGLSCLRLLRPSGNYKGCVVADTVAGACSLVRAGNVLATTGSKEILSYTVIPDFSRRVYARVLGVEESVAACRAAGLAQDHILQGRGPFSVEENVSVLRQYQIQSLITKDGGVQGGFSEKREAARICEVTPIVVRRPAEKDGISAEKILSLFGGEWS